MVKLLFNKKKSNVKKTNSRPKYIIKNNRATIQTMAPRLLHLPRKRGKDQRSINVGMYPIPTGKILERYAHKHNLSNALPMAKKILSYGPSKLIGLDEDIDRSIPKKQITYHEAVRRYKNICPCKDSDKDGVLNMADCRPFNKNKQDDDMKDYYGAYTDTGIDDNFEVEEYHDIIHDEKGRIRKMSPLKTVNPKSSHGVTVYAPTSKKIETIISKKSKCK